MTTQPYEPPSQKDWARLHQAAIEFKRLEPWKWLRDDEIFGVRDPISGTTGYCCVSGEEDDELGNPGLMVFMGDAGLARCLEMLLVPEDQVMEEEDIVIRASDILFNVHMITLIFADQEDLEDRDLAAVRSVGLKLRGQRQWPMFRSTRPGFLPWFLDKEEARFFTLALEQAMEIARQLQLAPASLSPVFSEDRLLVRVPEERAEGYAWHNEWVKPVVPEAAPAPMPTPAINQDLVQRVQENTRVRQGIWEVDVFLSPAPTGGPNERPYFPRATMCVDKSSGFVLDSTLDEPWLPLDMVGDHLLELMDKVEAVPRQIDVASDEVRAIVEPVCTALGIKLRRARRLPKLEAARMSAAFYIGGPPGP